MIASDVVKTMLALYEKTGEEFFQIAATVVQSQQVNGIPIIEQEIVERLQEIEEIPVVVADRIFRFKVDPKMLYWEIDETDLSVEDISDFFGCYAATALLVKFIDVNYWLQRAGFTANPLQIVTNILDELKATMLQHMAKMVLASRDIKSLRGRHITLDKSFRNFMVPRDLARQYLAIKKVWKHMIVVIDDTAYFHNGRNVKKLLTRLGIKAKRYKKVELDELRTMVQSFNEETDTLIGHVFRHPIIGYIGVGTFVLSDRINGIGVPADVAEKLDGDDDGDIIDATINIMIKGRKLEFATTIMDV